MNNVFELTKSTNLSTFLGGLIGFTIFVVLLESKQMGKILFRNDKFRINGLILYLKSPFHQKFLWYPQLWKHNWIMMSSFGALNGYILTNCI
jgi:hypothetical protein